MDVELRDVAIDQCSSGPGWFSDTHRCDPNSTQVPAPRTQAPPDPVPRIPPSGLSFILSSRPIHLLRSAALTPLPAVYCANLPSPPPCDPAARCPVRTGVWQHRPRPFQRCPSILRARHKPRSTPDFEGGSHPELSPSRGRRCQLLVASRLCSGHPSRKQQWAWVRGRMRPAGIRERGPGRGCRHGWAGLGRSAALGVHLGFREGFGAKLWDLILKCLTTDSSRLCWCGVR